MYITRENFYLEEKARDTQALKDKYKVESKTESWSTEKRPNFQVV